MNSILTAKSVKVSCQVDALPTQINFYGKTTIIKKNQYKDLNKQVFRANITLSWWNCIIIWFYYMFMFLSFILFWYRLVLQKLLLIFHFIYSDIVVTGIMTSMFFFLYQVFYLALSHLNKIEAIFWWKNCFQIHQVNFCKWNERVVSF